MSRDTYVQLHNIDKTGINDTLSEIFTQRDEKANIELEGIRFSSRNQQDSCIYRFEVTQGVVTFGDTDTARDYLRHLETYFKGFGYYNVKTSKFKIYLLPYNAYTMLYQVPLEYGRIPLTGRYLVYELTKVQ